MTSNDTDRGYYLRVYQAAARLFWRSSSPWREVLAHQPPECRDAWAHLEQVLSETSAGPAGPRTPPDPTHHLVSRRDDDERPVPISHAAHDWLARVRIRTGSPYPRDVIAENPEMRGQKSLSGDFVLVTTDWGAMAMKMVGELQHRAAPGRPACTIGSSARGLSDALHHYADQLRDALEGHVWPSPARATRPALAMPSPFPDDVDSERLDRLCWAAFEVVERTPGLAAVRAGEADTPDTQISKAIDVLGRTLAGREHDPWQGFNPRVDPADGLVGSSEDLTFSDYLDRLRTGRVAMAPAPRVPTEPVVIETGEDGVAHTGIPFTTALVLVEILDEVAGRLAPGTRSETIGVDAFPAYHDLAEIRRLLHRL